MRVSRTGGWVAGIAAVALLAGVTGAPPATSVATADATVPVVVQASSATDAAAAVTGQGGTVDRELEFVGGVAARISPDALAALEQDTTVRVTADTSMEFASTGLATASVGGEQLQAMNPAEHWSAEAGSGVGVALIDTGVVETPELAGRLIHGPDYSDEGDGVDRYGHGTFMAGLIAGDGSTIDGEHYGVAPGAHIVSLKLAGRDGVTTLSKVLDAIGWVVVNQDEYGIRVLNLSIGVPTNRAPQADPLSAAVQAAWASGITVVAASGNEGGGVVTSPGRDPWVITVGSTATNGTVDTRDDTVPSWSGSGKVAGNEKAELLAPGASVVSLRAPGSLIDETYPDARIGGSHFRGSGTSMSAALVSGAVAALAEFRPYATPDDFKGALVSTGVPIAGTTARAVDLAAADATEADIAWRQNHPLAFKHLGGSLKQGMPWSHSSSPAADETWARMAWADGQWARMAWADGQWTRMAWADGQWTRMAWADAEFTRMAWARMAWADANFARMAWADAHFTRMAWARMAWARMAWAGDAWTGDRTWVHVDWSASRWDGRPPS